jgi:hypothetical protein
MFGIGEKGSDTGAPIDSAKAAGLAAANGEVKSKHGRGGARPGAGRKPKNRLAESLGTADTEAEEQTQTPPSEADIEFVRTIAASGLKILSAFEERTITSLIRQIDHPSVTAKTEELLEPCRIKEGDFEVVTNAAAACASKYSVLGRYAPEVALIGWGVTHFMQFTTVLNSLKAISAEIKAAKGFDAGTSQTDENSHRR